MTTLPYTVGTPNQVGLTLELAGNGLSSNDSGIVNTNAPIWDVLDKTYLVFENDTEINVIDGLRYEIKCYISIGENAFDPLMLDNSFFYFLPNGYSFEECSVNPFDLNSSTTYSGYPPNTEDWLMITTSFIAKTTESVKCTFYQQLKEDVLSNSGVIFQIDDITFKGPIDYISENKPVKNNCDCSPYEAVVRWKNDLGGWDVWNFIREKTITENVTGKINIKRDITSNWDDTFINGDTQNDTIKTTANKSILLRSQLLSVNDMEVLQQLRRSVRVQLMVGDKWQTVTTKQGSFIVRDEGDKVREVSFEINLPDTVIQDQ